MHKASPLENNLAAQFVPKSTFLYRSGTYLSKAAAGKPLDIALNYFRANANAFNITAADIGTPMVTDQYTDTDTGMTHIYLRQQVNGLEIANANANFNVRSDGRILSIGSTFVSGIAELAIDRSRRSWTHRLRCCARDRIWIFVRRASRRSSRPPSARRG